MSLVRPELNLRHVCTAQAVNQAKDKAFVQVAGLVLVRQRPGTAKGVVFNREPRDTWRSRGSQLFGSCLSRQHRERARHHRDRLVVGGR